MDSPVESRVTAQHNEVPSNDRSVTLQPESSGRETKPSSTAACPSEKSPLSAGAAGGVAQEVESRGAEGGTGEISRRGERSLEGFF